MFKKSNSNSSPKLGSKFGSNQSQIFSVLIFLFYLFGFSFVEPFIIPPVQNWIQNSGSFAGLSYFLVGIVATVISPISLGPINVIMQKAFGFWSGFWLFYSFKVVGELINFTISRKFGDTLMHKFFPFLDKDPFFNLIKNNLNRRFIDLILIYLGTGGELIAYLFGLSKVSYFGYILISLIANFFNAFLFVSRNFSIGTNSFIWWTILEIGFGFLPLIIVFWKQVSTFPSSLKGFYRKANELEADLKIAKQNYKNGKITKEEFEQSKNIYKENGDELLQNLFGKKSEKASENIN